MRSGKPDRGAGSPGEAGRSRPGGRLPRGARIRSEEEIRRALRAGERRVRGPLEVYRAPSPAGRARIAVIVPLHGHGAVERNRLRRRVRELLRTGWLADAWDRDEALDLVVRTRRGAYDLSFSLLRAHLEQALDDEGSVDDRA